jgi:hypothetical protein
MTLGPGGHGQRRSQEQGLPGEDSLPLLVRRERELFRRDSHTSSGLEYELPWPSHHVQTLLRIVLRSQSTLRPRIVCLSRSLLTSPRSGYRRKTMTARAKI